MVLLFNVMSLCTGHHRSVNPTYTNHLKYYENVLVSIQFVFFCFFLLRGNKTTFNNHNQTYKSKANDTV